MRVCLIKYKRGKYLKFSCFVIIFLATLVLFALRFMIQPTFWANYSISDERVSILKNSDSPETIPKIFHHTWRDDNIPSTWKAAYNECIKLYPDWKFYLWSDKESEEFIKKFYPRFLDDYQRYQMPIQRADAIRYFLLYHYGGVYADLDIGCSGDHKIDPLLKLDAFIPKTKPIGFSNDLMGSKPNHPFFKDLIESLSSWDYWYIFPYLTVFFSTGPMFLSLKFGHYLQMEKDPIYILMPEVYSDGPSKIFKHYQGSTWHSWDAEAVKVIWAYRWVGMYMAITLILFFAFFKKISEFEKSE